jgi:hypothetical protein
MPRRRVITADELAQLERTLRWHFPRLHRETAEDPGALPDSHLAIAGHLRVLLCDHKYPPVLIEYAKARGIDLIVYASPIITSNKKRTVHIAWSSLIASWEPVPDRPCVAVDVESFLNSPIGVIQHDINTPSEAYTPRDVIQWVANTEGVSHFNYNDRKHSVHMKLKGSTLKGGVTIPDSELRKVLQQIGVWTLCAIEHVMPSEPPLASGAYARDA